MPQNIQKRPKLLIVSDTAMWNDKKKGLIAFEPVVREIEHFEYLFSEIAWIGYGQNKVLSANARGTKVEIRSIYLPAVGGSRIIDKIKILFKVPIYGLKVIQEIVKADVVHTRAPSLPAFIAILFSLVDKKRVYWHKYAGTWKDKAPWFYALQRWLLDKAHNTTVTINGFWPGQQQHLLNFENPCFSVEELNEAKAFASTKTFDSTLILCFVGNLTSAKGIIPLLEAFEGLSKLNSKQGLELHIAGDGILREEIEKKVLNIKAKVKLYGFLKRQELKKIYEMAHILCLPSKSEGFPKVVAEAAAYACIPIVSDVSSIGQYIKSGKNGFLLNDLSSEGLQVELERIVQDKNCLKDISIEAQKLSELFTYERYTKRIQKNIVDKFSY